MAQKIREAKLTVLRERAVLVAGVLKGMYEEGEEPLDELSQLVDTAGADIVGKVVQHLHEASAKHLIGTGKVEEIAELARKTKAQVVIFDNDLSSAQGRNLDKALKMRVIDRSEVILDIFASRARTRLSRNEVALAMHEYRLPRLRRLWTHLERQTGGIGVRGGPGERQIEVDRRVVEKRIYDLRREIAEMHARKERAVRRRSEEFFLACLVGYTNAGKSTLLNALTDADALVEDRLFSTLDTKNAAMPLGGGRKAILSDTVGFIRRLPHHLVASFHATLEEARAANLLIHVADGSSRHVRSHIAAVESVLRDLGCGDAERLLVFNKADVPHPDPVEQQALRREFPDAFWISALQGHGLDGLRAEVRRRSEAHSRPVTLSVPAADGKTLAWIATHLAVDARRFDGDRILFDVRVPTCAIEGLRKRSGDSLMIIAGDEKPPKAGWGSEGASGSPGEEDDSGGDEDAGATP